LLKGNCIYIYSCIITQQDLWQTDGYSNSSNPFGVKVIINHVPLSVLQEWLGHSSIFTTSIYTQITGMDTSQFMNQIQ